MRRGCSRTLSTVLPCQNLHDYHCGNINAGRWFIFAGRVSGDGPVGCRGGSRYVDGFMVLSFLFFGVMVVWFYGFLVV